MKNNNWISVKERLPEESGKYIVSDIIHCSMALFNANTREFYNIAKSLTDGESSMTFVIKWQPLPEQPEPDSNADTFSEVSGKVKVGM